MQLHLPRMNRDQHHPELRHLLALALIGIALAAALTLVLLAGTAH